MIRVSYIVWILLVSLQGCSEVSQSGDRPPAKPKDSEAAPAKVGADPADGPFGLSFGTKIERVRGAKPLQEPNLYELTHPPKPHPDFESIALVAYPETGICAIRGIGRTLEGDGAGADIRAKVDDIAAALQTKYGDPEAIDVCAGGDIQCESQFWMMTLDNGERAYAYRWLKPNDRLKKVRIGEVYVVAKAVNIQDSFPIIEYISDEKEECRQAELRASASAL